MNYYSDNEENPVANESVAAKTSLILKIEGYSAERVEADIAARLVAEIRADVRSELKKQAELAIAQEVRQSIAAVVMDALTESIKEGWQETNSWGEPNGERKSLKDRVSACISSTRESRRNLEETFQRVLDALLKEHFADDLAKMKAAFRQQIDKTLQVELQQGIRKAFGL